MEIIQSKEDFIRKVHARIDRLGGKLEGAMNPIRFRIGVLNWLISMVDKGAGGILVTAASGDGKISADPVYNWSDAYTITYLLTSYCIDVGGTQIDPSTQYLQGMFAQQRKSPAPDTNGLVFYGDERGERTKINSLRTVNKTRFDFEWNPGDRFYDYSDEQMYIVLNLVKCGAIHDIALIEQNGQAMISVKGEKALCAPANINLIAEEARKGIFPSAFGGDYKRGLTSGLTLPRNEYNVAQNCNEPECNKEFCLLGLCGYLEYLYRNGELYDFFLKRENLKIPNGVFNFTWKPSDGLKYISDAAFNTAMEMVKNGRLATDDNMIEGYKARFVKKSNVGRNENNNPVGAILDDIYANPQYTEEGMSFSLEGEICNCLDPFYVIYVSAAYIDYLIRSGQEDQIRIDREIYAFENRGRAKGFEKEFDFVLDTDCYLDVTSEEWNLAVELQKQGYVGLRPKVYTDEREIKRIAVVANDFVVKSDGDNRTLSAKIKNGESERRKHYDTHSYGIGFHEGVNLEKVFREESWPKMAGLAGFVDYLDMTGQLLTFEKKLNDRWEKERLATQKSLENIDSDILDKMVSNPDSDTLYCVIQGEDGTGRKEKAAAIARKLLELGKIEHFEEIDDIMSCEMLSYRLQHYSVPNEWDISPVAEKTLNGGNPTMQDVRSTLFLPNDNNRLGFYNNGCDYVTEKVTFKRKRIYIVTNIRDFLPAFEKTKIGDNSRASHLVECLGKYNKETYVILIDEKKYIDHLFSLFPQIKYLFGSAVITAESLTEKEIFEIYKKNLQPELREKILSDESYLNSFLEFCARNKKNFAMKNRELAQFLANYSNVHHDPDRMFKAMEIYSGKSTDELLSGVIGMENVKSKVREFKQYAIYRKYTDNKGMEIPNSNMHMLFTGNPGTGKTMIARIIGQILYDAGIIEENKVIEVEGKDLKGRYVGESGPKTAAKIDEAIGGVLFIDEAYAIGDDTFGKEVIATLIKSMEDRKDQFVVIFAGYPKEMQEFININSGINSRIGYKFHFEDYKETELLKIFNTKMTRAGYEYSEEEEIEKRVLRLCKVFRRKKDFGNGRFIDKVIQQTIIGRATREYTPETVNIINPEDIPSEEKLISTDVVEHVPYQKQLDGITGMGNVKKKIEEFARYVKFLKEVEESNPQAKIPDSNMHMIFTGNPGTGKTTIARIMVDLLYDVGILKERKYIEVERKDLVGEYVGKTAIKTGEIIERAMNGVLFIDEAYSLAPSDSGNDFGAEAIATLIKAMEDHKGELIVIFAGYKDEMRRFEKTNPGISSRIGYRFEFEDYTSEELVEMFSKQVTGSGFSIDADAIARAKTVMDYYRRKQNFGNGRFVSRLWQDTLTKHSANYNETTVMAISEADIPSVAEMNNTSIKKSNNASLDNIIGLKEVKEQMKTFESWVKFSMDAREKGLNLPAASLHMIFTGNPGTGKTTVARIVAQKLYDLGVIMENKVIEVDRSGLVGRYVGETALKTHDVIESAMGGVLFIDEAYMLADGEGANNFGTEAVNTLMKVMEDKKDDFVVIFAGYKKEMQDFLAINPGIESRIGYTFEFEDYNEEELLEIFVRKLEGYNFTVDEEAKKAALAVFKYFSHVPNFGNGRFVDKVIRQTLMNQAKRYDVNTMNYIDEEIIPTIEEMSRTMSDRGRFVMPGSLTRQDKERVATHEIGHAAVHALLRKDVPIIKVTIEPEGNGNLGYVEYGDGVNALHTRTDYLNEISTMLAGLESEKAFFGECSSGGSSDLSKAKDVASRMINELGMGEASFGIGENDIMSSVEINSIIEECRDNARRLIEENKEAIAELIKILVEKDVIDGETVRKAFE